MTSISLMLCKDDNELIKKSTSHIKQKDGGEWIVVPMLFKKIHEGLFVEYSFNDAPKEVTELINKSETIY